MNTSFYASFLQSKWTLNTENVGVTNDDVLRLFKNERRIPELVAKNEKNITKPIMLSQLLFGFPISVVKFISKILLHTF